jgi:hypothetical protein
VAAQAELPRSIQRQVFDIVGVTDAGPMAIFALDRCVRTRTVLLIVFFVAFQTGFPPEVLRGKVLPFLDIAEAMKIVSEALAMYSEIIGHHELTSDKYRYDQSDGQP